MPVAGASPRIVREHRGRTHDCAFENAVDFAKRFNICIYIEYIDNYDFDANLHPARCL
jgi:hypothetical protein